MQGSSLMLIVYMEIDFSFAKKIKRKFLNQKLDYKKEKRKKEKKKKKT